jgi:acetyl esterase/lipase
MLRPSLTGQEWAVGIQKSPRQSAHSKSPIGYLSAESVGNAMRYFAFALCSATALVLVSCQRASASPWQAPPGQSQVSIWPGAVPDPQAVKGPEETITVTDRPVAGEPWTNVEPVIQPTMTVFSPTGRNTGVAVVVFPGGGYQTLAIDLEGTEVCDWLTSKGITCVLLKYRVPGDGVIPHSGPYPDSPVALEDAQRTMGLVRVHASEWGVDPNRIGVLGFSAGGHLVAAISTHFGRRLYPHIDAADNVSCRPDFAVAIYPGHMTEHTAKSFQLNPYVPVSGRTPPTFLLQNEDDPVDDVENSLVYYAALKKAGVPVEMHLYAEGGHAFGLRRTKFPVTAWPRLVETWLQTIGMISN